MARRTLPRLAALLLALAAPLGLAGCGGEDDDAPAGRGGAPVLGGGAGRPQAAAELGFPAFATKNTTRVGAGDAVAAAAAAARAVFPARSRETRPGAVVLVDVDDWRSALSAAQLMSRPVRAPILFSRDGELPPASRAALAALAPTGAERIGGAQVIRVGDAPAPEGYEVRALAGRSPSELARSVDALHREALGDDAPRNAPVLVAPAGQAALAMPAAGLAAKAGTPVLWVDGATVPPATRAAVRAHGRPRILLLGPPAALPQSVATELGRLGRVARIAAEDAPASAVAFARYSAAGFGWGVTDPGHGFVFASPRRPQDAAAAAPLSASGTYGPLLLVSRPARLDRVVEEYLLDVQPGYQEDPVRGVYNHGWVIGDEASVSVDVQARIDALLEIAPVEPQEAN